jgi:hypothetical protein
VCPKCKVAPERGNLARQVIETKRPSDSVLDQLSLGERLQIEAQDRTTQAVRSLAITFVAAPLIVLALTVGIALSVSSGEIGLVVLSILIAIGVSLYILIAAINALRKSELPNYLN